MDRNTKFLIDECLSPQLAQIAKNEFGLYAVHVPWLGRPPYGHSSWKDPDIDRFCVGYEQSTGLRGEVLSRGRAERPQRPGHNPPEIRP
jgi:hypothetical protein